MHEVDNVIVQDGKLTLSKLPYADGQRVRVVIVKAGERRALRRPIEEVRKLLKGGVERFYEPLEPMIPNGSWQMLK